LIEDKHVEKILGKYGGNTLAYGGDPAKGAEDAEARPMYGEDYVEVCKVIGQDAMCVEAFWLPYYKEDEEGRLIPALDRSVKNIKDFKKLKLQDKDKIYKLVSYIKEYKEAARNTKIGVTVVYAILIQNFYEAIVGMNDFMMACYEDRSFIEEMLEESTEYWVQMSRAIIEAGVDFIWPADDIAFKTGLFLPIKLMKEIWVPRMKRIIEPALEAGIPVLFHSDGKIDEIIEDLIDIGVDCINPLDPYGVNYREYKKKYGDRLALAGNIDVEFPLSKGTPEDVVKDVREHMDIMKPGYGYIACSSHSIVNYIPYKNFIAMINAIHELGKY
jgi:uroporphyrinogen decarboxylase